MVHRKYQLVYCTPALYSAGGIERMVSFKASYFAEVNGDDVTIIVTEGQGRDCFFPLSPKVKVVNLQLNFEQLWGCSFPQKVVLYLQKQYRYKRLVTRELMRIRPDITISVLRREINFLNAVSDGSRKIGELHVSRSNYRNFSVETSNPLKRLFSYFWQYRLIGHLKKLDRMVLLTETAKTDWPELSNLSVIPNPLPFNVYKTSSLTDKRIICIGRYAYEKGFDLLLNAWARIAPLCPGWRLDVYGDGLRDAYLRQCNDLGLEASVCQLHGRLTDVRKAYLQSAVFALPSRSEGFGLVVIEAMACGLPVVCFDCESGPRSIVTEGMDGFLVRPFDVETYADKLLQLIQQENLRKEMGRCARRSADRYSMEHIAPLWRKLFDEVVSA
jgi:glycosyltransferase involved in cell wall biosynthesis